MPQPYRQDLSKASGGMITGRGGRTQQLGKAAMRRMPAALAAPKPAWQQLAEKGIGGQGSAAANKAALAGGAGGGASATAPEPRAGMMAARLLPGGGVESGGFVGGKWQPNTPSDAARVATALPSPAGPGGPGGPTDMGIAKRMPPRGGMASYLPNPGVMGARLRPPAEPNGLTDFMDRGVSAGAGDPGLDFGPTDAQREQFAGLPQGGTDPAGRGFAGGDGVNSNAFAANGGTPSGAPLQQPGGGQGARIQALIARLRGGGAGLQPQMMAR